MDKLNLKYMEPIPKTDKLTPITQYYQVDGEIFNTKLDLYAWKRFNNKNATVIVHKLYKLENF